MKHRHFCPRPLHQQQGLSSIAFCLSAIPLFLLFGASIETARWYIHKYQLRTALLMAARQAALEHGKPQVIKTVFEQQLSKYLGQHHHRSLLPWQITIQNPDASVFSDFRAPQIQVPGAAGLAVIRNTYQYEQHLEHGIGAQSGQTIYEANRLTLQLNYPYQALIPGVSYLFKQLAQKDGKSLKQAYLQQGLLPIEFNVSVSMQSHPVMWPDLSNRQVMRKTSSLLAGLSPSPNANDLDPCLGLWCQHTAPLVSNKPVPSDDMPQTPAQAHIPINSDPATASMSDTTPQPEHAEHPHSADNSNIDLSNSEPFPGAKQCNKS
ncbi:TadE/TadG family type IV pilus assembly protein [Brackiella oedipodis]|uniref:TadE/TadG family type IV pilus assembly protein n=1 Tax=Brackiella oedipodis TaxID=124225 RepID=UPI00048BA3D9|nr:hypothetical protein [Brackiella oedipodis]